MKLQILQLPVGVLQKDRSSDAVGAAQEKATGTPNAAKDSATCTLHSTKDKASNTAATAQDTADSTLKSAKEQTDSATGAASTRSEGGIRQQEVIISSPFMFATTPVSELFGRHCQTTSYRGAVFAKTKL